jgi:hypothetical protein
VAALRQHLGPLRDPPHRRLRDAWGCPNCRSSNHMVNLRTCIF